MRFLMGLALGFAAGFAGVILFTPDRSKREASGWPPKAATDEAGASENHDSMKAFRRAVRSLQEQVSEAMTEAKEASREAEEELRARYERMARRGNGGRK